MDEEREFLYGDYTGVSHNQQAWTRGSPAVPNEVKAKIVSEGLRPGTTVNEVAQRYGLRANSLSTWRTMARQGKLILPAPEDAIEFAAVIVDPPVSELPPTAVGRAEIVVGPVTIRLQEGASAARIAAIARVLMSET
jgi:transposase